MTRFYLISLFKKAFVYLKWKIRFKEVNHVKSQNASIRSGKIGGNDGQSKCIRDGYAYVNVKPKYIYMGNG